MSLTTINYADYFPAVLNVPAEQEILQKNDIAYTNKNEKNCIDITKMTDHIATVFPAYCVGKSIYFYDNNTGIYALTSDTDIKRILKAYIETVLPGFWEYTYANQLCAALPLSLPAVKTNAPVADFLTFKNGTLHLSDMSFTAHSEQHYATNHIPHNYDEAATCPLFENAIATIFDNDSTVIQCFWEMFGYILYYGNNYPLQKIFIFYGKGANGKSLVLDVIRYVLGSSNYASSRLDEISAAFGASTFHGKMLNISPETELTSPANTALLKSITGGDAVTTNFKHQNAFSAKHYTKFIIATNSLFPMTDKSNGMFRRLHVFPFNQTFHEPPADGEKEEGILYSDKDLFSKLKSEVAGIINAALAGLTHLRNNNWNMTTAAICNTYNQKLKNAYNPFAAFCKEHIKVKPGASVKRSVVINEFFQFQSVVQIGNTYQNYTRATVYTNILQELQSSYPTAKIVVVKHIGDFVFRNIELV